MKVRNNQDNPREANRHQQMLLTLLGCLVLLLGLTTSGNAEPARFLYQLSYPESGQLLEAGNITCDVHTGEIFVTDVKNQRVVIFDKSGRYSFDFRNPEHLSGLRQVAVDSLGRIFVLRESRDASISVFDYNGEYLHDFNLLKPGTDERLEISSIVMDEQDRLYALTVMPAHIYVYSSDGSLLNDYLMFAGLDSLTRHQLFYGTMALVNGSLVVPIPGLFSVARYTTDGQFIRLFGSVGGGPGGLSFPIAAAGDLDGNIWVLDKHRHVLLQYNESGQYVREIGGRGPSAGWFYHPTSLACNQQGEAIVGQTFQGRIQAISFSERSTSPEVYVTAGANNGK